MNLHFSWFETLVYIECEHITWKLIVKKSNKVSCPETFVTISDVAEVFVVFT
jgi:hypothetical protein